MQELFAVIFSIILIPVLSKKKVPIGIAICICAILMPLIGGLGFSGLWNAVVKTFTKIEKIQQIIVMAEIGILGVLIKKYGLIGEIIGYLNKVIRSRRIMLMVVPALIGLLVVPGGAVISAPFVDLIGEEVKLPNTQKAIINNIFRHAFMNILPYNASLLLFIAVVPQISIYKLIGLNFVFIVMYCISGYILYIRKVENDNAPRVKPVLNNLIGLLKYTSPIYLAVLLNLIFKVPFYIGMLVNFLAIFLLHRTKTFIIDTLRAFNIKILLVLIGIFLIQGIIVQMNSLSPIIAYVFSNPKTIIPGIIAISFMLGMMTGQQITAVGVVLPILVALPISDNLLLLYCYLTFMWGFMGYFFSPLHLCQILTCECLNVSAIDLYKEKKYWMFFISLTVIIMACYYVFGIWLK